MSKQKLISVGLLLLLLLIGAGYKLYGQRETARTATGTVEMTKSDITAKISGYLAALTIKEGDHVDARQLVAQIDRKELTAQLTRDTAALAKAKARLVDLEKGARQEELREAAANREAAASVYEKTSADYMRYQALFASGAIAEQQLDNAKSVNIVAEKSLAATREKENLLRAGNRSDLIRAQQLEVTRCEAILESTRIIAADIAVFSPLNGLIISKNFELGEYVNVGSAIATVADMNDCWVRIYVASNELGLIKIGQTATVKIDAFPDRIFAGKITEISDKAEFTPRQSITKSERANLVFAVKIAVANEDGILKPGMPADVVLP